MSPGLVPARRAITCRWQHPEWDLRHIRLPKTSANWNCDFIAWTVDISQAHRDRGSRRHAGRNADVDLIQCRISRRLAEPQHVRHAAADGDVRRDDTVVYQS